MSDPGTEAGLFLLKQGFCAMPASPASGHNRRDSLDRGFAVLLRVACQVASPTRGRRDGLAGAVAVYASRASNGGSPGIGARLVTFNDEWQVPRPRELAPLSRQRRQIC